MSSISHLLELRVQHLKRALECAEKQLELENQLQGDGRFADGKPVLSNPSGFMLEAAVEEVAATETKAETVKAIAPEAIALNGMDWTLPVGDIVLSLVRQSGEQGILSGEIKQLLSDHGLLRNANSASASLHLLKAKHKLIKQLPNGRYVAKGSGRSVSAAGKAQQARRQQHINGQAVSA